MIGTLIRLGLSAFFAFAGLMKTINVGLLPTALATVANQMRAATPLHYKFFHIGELGIPQAQWTMLIGAIELAGALFMTGLLGRGLRTLGQLTIWATIAAASAFHAFVPAARESGPLAWGLFAAMTMLVLSSLKSRAGVHQKSN